MVNTRHPKYLDDLEELLPEDVKQVVMPELIKRKEARKRDRTPPPPPPEGGITLSGAERKYGLSHYTFRRWADAGLVPVLAKCGNRIYIDAARTAELVEKYLAFPGRGKRTVYQKN